LALLLLLPILPPRLQLERQLLLQRRPLHKNPRRALHRPLQRDGLALCLAAIARQYGQFEIRCSHPEPKQQQPVGDLPQPAQHVAFAHQDDQDAQHFAIAQRAPLTGIGDSEEQEQFVIADEEIQLAAALLFAFVIEREE